MTEGKINLFDGKWHGLSIRKYREGNKIIDIWHDIDNDITETHVTEIKEENE